MNLPIIDALRHSQNLIYFVNTQSQFGFLNDCSVKCLSFSSEEHALSHGYADMHCRANELACFYNEQDRLTVKMGKPTAWLALAKYGGRDEKTLFYGTKSPVFDKEKNVIGIFANFMDATDHQLINLSDLLLGDTKFLNRADDQITYQVGNYARDYKLSPKESVVLFYMLRGQSAASIAQKLRRSPRTIESHIESIKNKMDCLSKSELVEKSIDCGLLNILPRHIISLNMSGL